MHILYRFFNRHEELLYIGITSSPSARLRSHRNEKDWWLEVATIRLEHFQSRVALAEAECLAIRAEKPRYNVALNTDSTQPYSRVIPPHEFDITDAGYEIVLVWCPYCGEGHKHFPDEDALAATCGLGWYWIR